MKSNSYSFFLFPVILFLLTPAHSRAQLSPNFDFENWTTQVESLPHGWLTNNTYGPDSVIRVNPITGVTGNGIHLQTDSTGFPVPGYVYNSAGNVFAGEGGVPYSGSGIPANLDGYYRYNIVAGDSARMFVLLKKSGVVLSMDSFIIYGTQPSFISFSLPLTTVSDVPDSIIFLACSGTLTFPMGAAPGSFLDLDQLSFTNGTSSYALLDGDFDTWSTVTVETPDSWNPSGNVSKSTDRESGSFAVKLVTSDNGSGLESGVIYGSTVMLSAAPNVDTLTGYYKYSTPGADKGGISVILWDHMGTGASYTKNLFLPPVATFTYFQLPLNNPINASDFNFLISSSTLSLVDGSTLLIDDLKVKVGHPVTAVSPVKNIQGKLSFYPIPCKDVVHVSADGAANIDNSDFVLYNIYGQQVGKGTISGNSIYLKNVANGIYMCVVHAGDEVSYGRIEVVN